MSKKPVFIHMNKKSQTIYQAPTVRHTCLQTETVNQHYINHVSISTEFCSYLVHYWSMQIDHGLVWDAGPWYLSSSRVSRWSLFKDVFWDSKQVVTTCKKVLVVKIS